MTLSLTPKIRSSKVKDTSKVSLLTNFSYQKIIVCIYDEAKTVKQISKETGLTLSTTYRKVNELNKNHLLILSGSINSENKREFSYKIKRDIIDWESFT